MLSVAQPQPRSVPFDFGSIRIRRSACMHFHTHIYAYAQPVQVFDAEEPELFINSGNKAIVQHGSLQLGNKSHVYIASSEFEAANPEGPMPGKLEAADYDFSKLSPVVVEGAGVEASPGKRARGGDGAPAAGAQGGAQTCVYTLWSDKRGVDGVFARCAEVGCGTVTMPPTHASWGMYWGELRDPWGVRWMVTANVPKDSDAGKPSASVPEETAAKA